MSPTEYARHPRVLEPARVYARTGNNRCRWAAERFMREALGLSEEEAAATWEEAAEIADEEAIARSDEG